MSKCENCIHDGACHLWCKGYAVSCDNFKDKSLFIELPCKVGDDVWFNTFKKNATVCVGIQPHKVDRIDVVLVCGEKELIETRIPIWQIGKWVFLSREEAEKKYVEEKQTTKDTENYKYCDSYDEKEEIVGWATPNKPITNTVGRCRGTKEYDVCSCEGNQFKCDFYEYIREGAKNNKVKEPTPTLNYTYIFTDNDGVTYKIHAKSKKDAVGIFNKKYGIPFWFIRKYFTIKKEK